MRPSTLALLALPFIAITTIARAAVPNPIDPPKAAPGDSFRWQADQFADVRVLRYQVPGWEQLSLKEKTLAYYLTWHLREAWAELIFKDECPPTPADPVAKAKRSAAANTKAASKRTKDGHPCHNYESLIGELGLRTRNTIRLQGTDASYDQLTEPSALQARALELITNIPKHP